MGGGNSMKLDINHFHAYKNSKDFIESFMGTKSDAIEWFLNNVRKNGETGVDYYLTDWKDDIIERAKV